MLYSSFYSVVLWHRKMATNFVESMYLVLCGSMLLADLVSARSSHGDYQGLYLGKFNTYAHQVSGEIYAVDEYTLLIKNFIYDGLGQDTFFWAGSTVRPSNLGFIVPDEEGRTNKLQAYVNKDITIRLPDRKKITSIKWLSLYNIKDHRNFADIYIPEGFEPPAPQRLSELSRRGHNVQSDAVVVQDSKSLLIPNFYFDGNSTSVYFMAGEGPQPNPSGKKIPDEKGYLNSLKRYEGEDVVLELPGELTIFDVDWISVWNVDKKENYGSVIIPDGLNIPPSLVTVIEHESGLPNCEQLHKDLQVSWEIFGPQITFQLSAQIDLNDYIAFGVSGSPNSSQMIGGDAAVSFFDGLFSDTFDYNITEKYPCSNVLGANKGVCRDIDVGGVESYQSHPASRKDGITTITYRRSWLNSGDEGDKIYSKDGDTYIIWAIGKYNKYKEPRFHHTYPKGDFKINFGRKPAEKNCYHFTRNPQMSKVKSWGPLRIKDRTLNTFYARLGQDGGQKGYVSIAETSSPGFVWYINGLMTPEIYVKRGKTYTFKIEGGNNPYNATYYHPFYITDDPQGGYMKYSEADRKKVNVYAGVDFDRRGRPHPTAAGRCCVWVFADMDPRRADNYPTFLKFRDALKYRCEQGDAKTLFWTPNATIPDVVYYQSYTQRNMGWKIHVVDEITDSSSVHVQAAKPTVIIPALLCIYLQFRRILRC